MRLTHEDDPACISAKSDNVLPLTDGGKGSATVRLIFKISKPYTVDENVELPTDKKKHPSVLTLH